MIKDIKYILNDTNYEFRINISTLGIEVIIGEEVFEDEVYKVVYGYEKFAYVETDNKFLVENEFSLSSDVLEMLNNVAQYLERNKEYIDKLMEEF